MPTATEVRSSPRSSTPAAQIILPRMAASESSAAKPSTSAWPKVERSTRTPISTKKTGTRKPAIGWISSSIVCLVRSPRSPVVHAVEDQPGGEGAHDGGEADAVGEIGEQEAGGERQREQHALDLEEARQPEHALGEPAADQDRADQEAAWPCR